MEQKRNLVQEANELLIRLSDARREENLRETRGEEYFASRERYERLKRLAGRAFDRLVRRAYQ